MKQFLSLMNFGCSILIMILFIGSIPALATKTFEPIYKPTLEVKRATAPVKIDGVLDDVVWKSASRADNFVERNPGDMVKPEVETEDEYSDEDEF